MLNWRPAERLRLALVVNLDLGLRVVVDHREWPKLNVPLDRLVIKFATDETFGVKDCVVWIHGNLVLGSVANETLGVGERNIRGRCSVALVVGNDLNLAMLQK